MVELVWLIPALPLAGFVLLAIAGGRLPRPALGAVGAGSVGLSALAPDFATSSAAGGNWSEQKLLGQIEKEIRARQKGEVVGSRPFRGLRWALPYAAAILLAATLSVYSYYLGTKGRAPAAEEGPREDERWHHAPTPLHLPARRSAGSSSADKSLRCAAA